MQRSVQQKYRTSAETFGEGEQYENIGSSKTIVRNLDGETFDLPDVPISPADPCKGLVSIVERMEGQITSDQERKESIEESIAKLEAARSYLPSAELDKQIANLEKQKKALEDDISAKEAQIAQYKLNYPDCF